MPGPPSETVELMVRRAALLCELWESPRTKQDLASALPVSRSTVDRAVRVLESQGLVERGSRVSLTLRGRLALDAYERFVRIEGDLDDASVVLDQLPRTATADTALFRGADVVDATRETPQRPVYSFLEEAERATGIHGFASAVLATTVEAFHERIVDHGAIVDLTMPEAVLNELLDHHGEYVHEALDTGRFTIHEATTTLAYSLMLVEQSERTVVCALVYGDRGLAGVVKNDAPYAVEWADSVCEALRADASQLPT